MSGIAWNVLSYIVAIGVLVAFHEFGHYWVARRLGIKVLKFSVGFGKALWTRRAKDGVEWQIGSIPLGGFVKLLDEREGPVAPEDLPRAFNRQPVAKRIAVFAAGPVFNFLLAVALYWGMYLIGVPGMKPLIAEPAPGTLAAAAGLHARDRIDRVDDTAIPVWSVLREELLSRALARNPAMLAVHGADGSERQVALDPGAAGVDPEQFFDKLGLEPWDPPIEPVIGELVKDGPASRAGFQSGDRLLRVDGQPVLSFQQLRQYISERPGHLLKAEIQRGDQQLAIGVILATEKAGDKPVGRLGVAPARMADAADLWQDSRASLRLSPWAAVPAALNQTRQVSVLTLHLLYRMLVGDVSVKNVSGPIQIAQAAGSSASAGPVAFFGFIALVSISIGIFNLLPIPMLDGGQILFGLIEAVKGSPLSERMQLAGQQVGLTLLMLLMGLAFYNDIMRQIG